MKLLMIFIVLNVVNVVVQTIKSICTVKCGKTLASLVNALAYGIYTVVLVYMNCDLSLWAKVAVVSGANLVGVYVVKIVEEKMRKDRLWKVEVTIPADEREAMICGAKNLGVSWNTYDIDPDHAGFNFYCNTQADSMAVKTMLAKGFHAKYFVVESKIL